MNHSFALQRCNLESAVENKLQLGCCYKHAIHLNGYLITQQLIATRIKICSNQTDACLQWNLSSVLAQQATELPLACRAPYENA